MTMKTLSVALVAALSLTASAWAADNSQTTPQGHWEWRSAPQYGPRATGPAQKRSEEHTSELQSLMRISYEVFCLKKKTSTTRTHKHNNTKRISQPTNPNTTAQHNIQ